MHGNSRFILRRQDVLWYSDVRPSTRPSAQFWSIIGETLVPQVSDVQHHRARLILGLATTRVFI